MHGLRKSIRPQNHWKSVIRLTLNVLILRLKWNDASAASKPLLVVRGNVQRLRSCWRRTFWAHAVTKVMWCDTCDIWRHNNCYSCLLIFSWSFLRRRMRYPVWIRVVTVQTTTSEFHKVVYASIKVRWPKSFVKLFHDFVCQKLFKSANVSRRYSKKWHSFLRHGV